MGLFGKKKTQEELVAEGKSLYERGEYGKALIQFLKAKQDENGERDCWAGRCYLARGDRKEAKRHLTQAAERGNQEAERLLAEMEKEVPPLPEKEKPVSPPPVVKKPEAAAEKPEKKEPVPVLAKEKKSAKGAEKREEPPKKEGSKKEKDSFRELLISASCLYSEGRCQEAQALMEQAMEQGGTEALHICGWMYHQGQGVERDLSKAFACFRKAADKGHAPSYYQCARMYEAGEGTRMDQSAAWACYRMAAEQDHPRAFFRCGVCCITGSGVPRNVPQAKMWFQKAAAQTEDEKIKEMAEKVLRERF